MNARDIIGPSGQLEEQWVIAPDYDVAEWLIIVRTVGAQGFDVQHGRPLPGEYSVDARTVRIDALMPDWFPGFVRRTMVPPYTEDDPQKKWDYFVNSRLRDPTTTRGIYDRAESRPRSKKGYPKGHDAFMAELYREAFKEITLRAPDGTAVWWTDLDRGPVRIATLWDLVTLHRRGQPQIDRGRPLWLLSGDQWDKAEYPAPSKGGPPYIEGVSVGREPGKMPAMTAAREDYPDFEAALRGAQSNHDATHVTTNGEIAIYSPTSRGYVKRTMFRQGGGIHWTMNGPVTELPSDARMIHEVIETGWDPESVPASRVTPMRRAAEEARGSDRERWDKLQSEFRRLTDEMTKVESEAHVKWGPHGLRYASRALQTKHARLKASRNRVYEKIFAMTQKLSPRDWGTGVPTWWVASKLTFDDLVRPQSEPLSVTPPLAYGATRPMQEGARKMGAVRERVAREQSDIGEEMREFLKREFPDGDEFSREAAIYWYASDYHGGQWSPLYAVLSQSEFRPGHSHRSVNDAGEEAVMMYDALVAEFEGSEVNEASEAAIPTKAQFKVIEAFRQRRLMGNPMRDSISTDGDTIYSYRMPIAGRNPRGGIWIADPKGAPSATTRNHIYGLQRTFTPAEITSAAEHDDDRGPDTERAPAPEAAPRLQPGYAFYTPSKRRGDWKKIPNDDWEHVIVSEDEIEKADLVGYRLIDGSMHDIFEIAFTGGRRSKTTGYYAQLQTHTRGRSAAHEGAVLLDHMHEGAVLLDHMANDFTSPKEAIEHAQRSWGATHVDFHGTRNQPTVYGTKDGARWKKTLYKEKGKFHWPDKFSKGPKRLSGAIELTPVTIVARPRAPSGYTAPELLPPGMRPPLQQILPDDDYERHLPGHSDEAQEADPRYFSRQNQKLAHVDDVFYEGKWIGWVKGPFKGARRADFFEWEIPSSSDPPPFGHSAKFGESRNRRSAFNALVRAHKTLASGTREASEARRPQHLSTLHARVQDLWKRGRSLAQIEDELHVTVVVPGGIADQSPNILRGNFRIEPGMESSDRRRTARENPATDLQDAIPWVRVTRDPERYKEALARAQKIGPVDDARKVYELVGPALMKEDQETFIVVLIDVRQNCRGVAEIHRGARSRVATSVLDVMRVVVASGAEGFIVVHNHPSGKAMPSDADRSLTKAIERAARPFKGETAFLDHVVCGAGEYYSFADSKLHKAKN